MIDGERVREITWAFRKGTSCAEDHIVSEMLRELDADIWETSARCFRYRLQNHWTECDDQIWKTQMVTMVQKKNGKLTMRGFRPIAMLPTIYRIYSKTLQQLAGDTLQARTGPQFGHVPGRQAHEVVWMLRRMVEQATEWQIPFFVMDCDVAAAFDHVSHHEIIKATMDMVCPADVDCSLDQETQKFRDCGAIR